IARDRDAGAGPQGLGGVDAVLAHRGNPAEEPRVWGALRHSVNPDRILQIEAATRTPVSQPPLVVDPASGLLRGVRQVPSPNCDDRPPGVVPDLIVVHAISLPPGQFGGPWIDALFTNTLD